LEYLKICGVSENVATQVYDSAIAQRKHTALPREVPFPPTWKSSVTLADHVDVIMHLLFLGIVKTVIELVMLWLKKDNRHSRFGRMVVGDMTEIGKLGLGWLNVLPFSSNKFTTGFWVANTRILGLRMK
jgi:hypothetical protein